MTVIIAAICTFQKAHMVVAVADRMITAGDIEFEQPQPKGFAIGEHAVYLMFGDVAAQSTVATAALKEILHNRITSMEKISETYADVYAKHRLGVAESAILKPLGLNRESFLEQQSLAPSFLSHLKSELQGYDLDRQGGAVLIGADNLGAHIYVVNDPGVATCMDSTGFVARGSGQWHAESQFMFARYVKTWDLERALYLAYTAKKRAEVAPGVGTTETDIIMITTAPRNISHYTDGSTLVDGLKQIYAEVLERDKSVRDSTDEKVRQFLQGLLKPPTPPTEPPGPPGPPTEPPTPPKGTQ